MQKVLYRGEKAEHSSRRAPAAGGVLNYISVLKPLPSLLLTFIGAAAAFIAGAGQVSGQFLVIIPAVLMASAGANGLTNYLDRDIDARMQRTRCRALPSGSIHPPEKALPLIIGLIIAGLVLAWYLHPYVFLADAAGTLVAATWRKKVTCVYPQGVLASTAPILMGWLAVRTALSWELLFLGVLIAVWLPLHVWSVNITHRDDYRRAGLDYFPINLEVRQAVRVLFGFSVLLYAASVALYFIGDYGWLYLTLANILGIAIVITTGRLMLSRATADAWKVYRLSAFPYLGTIFLVICLDIWLIT